MIAKNNSRPRARIVPAALLLGALGLCAASCAKQVSVADLCGEGLTQCGEACVDPQSDVDNCGGCGNACPEDAGCASGTCVAICEAGLTSCDGICVDTQTDGDHCGGCGFACPDSAPCTEGVCLAPCPDGLLVCDGGCVDATTDVLNCGACGNVCQNGDDCVGGVCGACEGGLFKCAGQCVDTQTSSQHCGGCGLACAAGYACVNGGCVNNCPNGMIPCNGLCTDLQTNNQNCGVCGNVCATGESCQAGVCVCPGGDVCGLCAVDVGSTIPQSVNGSTVGAVDSFTPSCSFGSSGDVGYTFTAPADGFYSFRDTNYSYSSVMSVVDPSSCGELGCVDVFSGASKITTQLTMGQTILVVVDGNNFESGTFTVEFDDVPPPVCPTGDLGSIVPQTIMGTTINAGDAITPGCNFAPSGDVSYTFTAPAAGSYSFDTYGSFTDTIISVRDAGCNGMELSCNDNGPNGQGFGESYTWVTLAAGQQVLVSVEGAGGQEGDFTLNVNTFVPPPCPETVLPSMVPQTISGNTTGGINFVLPNCGGSDSPERTYSFTAPASAMYEFNTFGSSYDTVIAVRNATCGGAELACNDDWGGGTTESQVMVQLAAGQTVVVVVDGYGAGNSGPFTLNIQ